MNVPENSVNVLSARAHDPVFFQKLANDWNIRPRTQDEHETLLEMATMLREAKETDNVKTASAGNSFLSGALDNLKLALGNQGYNTTPTSEVVAIKQAAANAAQNQELQDAAIEYGQYLASLSE